jgi:hypothetical protein
LHFAPPLTNGVGHGHRNFEIGLPMHAGKHSKTPLNKSNQADHSNSNGIKIGLLSPALSRRLIPPDRRAKEGPLSGNGKIYSPCFAIGATFFYD